MRTKSLLRRALGPTLTPGISAVLAIALLSSALVALLPARQPKGITLWIFTPPKRDAYENNIAEWNRAHPELPVSLQLISGRAMEQRMLSGFLAGTPMADMMDTYEQVFPQAFLGPLEQVGFLDITDRLHSEGLYAQFNEPSFSQMTRNGRIFGLPHDVHPVLLAYRADLVEAAGIDVTQIETWDDYFRIMRPLMDDHDGDGRPDHYLLNLSEINEGEIVMLFLQNEGRFFDEDDRPSFANARTAHTLATITTWITGPEQVALHVSDTPAGHRQRLDGLIIGTLAPDWMIGSWKRENPKLAGKVKLMPLPAWEKGGRRTSVLGGSMMAITRTSPHAETACWEVAKRLYTSAEVAESTWRQTNILSPVKALWDEPFYHQPDPFCCGQDVGQCYIDQAPYVPLRASSPYTQLARLRLMSVVMALKAYADRNGLYDAAALEPEALRLLEEEQASLERLISRNRLLASASQG